MSSLLTTLRTAYTDLTGRPQPVLTRAGIGGVIALLAAMLVHFNGGGLASWLHVNQTGLASIILFVGPQIGAWLSRSKVTPLADPKTAAGVPLVPASVVSVPVAAVNPVALADLIFPTPAAPAAAPTVITAVSASPAPAPTVPTPAA